MNARRLAAAITIAATLAAAAYYYDLLLLMIIGRNAGIAVSCGSSVREGARRCAISNLKLSDDRHAIALMSREAHVEFAEGLVVPHRMLFDLLKTDCRWKPDNASERTASQADEIAKYVIPLIQGCHVSGVINIDNGTIGIERFLIENDRLSITAHGLLRNTTVAMDLKIRLRKDVLSSIPDAFINALFEEDQDRWRTITLSIKGNRKTPAVEIASTRFKLTVRERELQNE